MQGLPLVFVLNKRMADFLVSVIQERNLCVSWFYVPLRSAQVRGSPNLLRRSRLTSMENVFLTPHIAGSFGDEIARMGEYVVEECTHFMQHEPCRYEITEQMLKTMA